MEKYIGFDVSLQTTHVCVVDSEGKTVREGIAASEVDALGLCCKNSVPALVVSLEYTLT